MARRSTRASSGSPPRRPGYSGETGRRSRQRRSDSRDGSRLAVAFGTALPRGSRVVASRGGTRDLRMIERSLIAGINSTGVDVADLRTLPSAVGRHLLKTHDYAAGLHVGFTSAIRRSPRSGSSKHRASRSLLRSRRRSRSTFRGVSFGAPLRPESGRSSIRCEPGKVMRRTAGDARHRGDQGAEVPDRRRLRVLVRIARPADRPRAAGRRGGFGACLRIRRAGGGG